MGIGGSIWFLFLGRIIDGLTGGNISTLFAYFSDIILPKDRTKYFGLIGAISGIGVISGPILGGFLCKFGYLTPFYFGAFVTLLNLVYGIFFMPETLKDTNCSKGFSLLNLNPFSQFKNIAFIKNLKPLFLKAFLLWLASGVFQGIFAEFSMEAFKFDPKAIGLILSILGFQDIFSQIFIMPKLLLKFNDSMIISISMISETIGYIFFFSLLYFLSLLFLSLV